MINSKSTLLTKTSRSPCPLHFHPCIKVSKRSLLIPRFSVVPGFLLRHLWKCNLIMRKNRGCFILTLGLMVRSDGKLGGGDRSIIIFVSTVQLFLIITGIIMMMMMRQFCLPSFESTIWQNVKSMSEDWWLKIAVASCRPVNSDRIICCRTYIVLNRLINQSIR